MEKYKEVLEKVAKKEFNTSIIMLAILFLIIVIVWAFNYIYLKRLKNKSHKKYNSKKQVKIRRQSLGASIILTVMCVCLGVLVFVDTADIISNINKDIEENAYITYTGEYYVYGSYTRHSLYDRWLNVTFENDDYALMYMNDFFERISSDEGSFNGKVVYGRNSLIVVETEN